MASRDESHLFSLAALTTRSPAFPPQPSPRTPDTSDLTLAPTDRTVSPPSVMPQSSAWPPLFPLGAPLGGSEPLEPAPKAQPSRARTIALVVAASLLGAGIVAAAAWSGETAPPTANLGPEVSTEALAQLVPQGPSASNEVTAPPDVPVPVPDPTASAAAAAEPVPPPSKPPRRAQRPPRTQPPPDRGATTPAPAPARGPCSHCSAGDLACNIKCRAGG